MLKVWNVVVNNKSEVIVDLQTFSSGKTSHTVWIIMLSPIGKVDPWQFFSVFYTNRSVPAGSLNKFWLSHCQRHTFYLRGHSCMLIGAGWSSFYLGQQVSVSLDYPWPIQSQVYISAQLFHQSSCFCWVHAMTLPEWSSEKPDEEGAEEFVTSSRFSSIRGCTLFLTFLFWAMYL